MSRQGKGAYKRIRDMGLVEFLDRFPDEESARDYLVEQRWGDGMYCPLCGNSDPSRISTNDRPPLPHHCKDCRRHFSVRAGTVMAASKISLRNWLLAIYLITVHRKGISSLALARELGITQKSAWYLGHRIRAAFEDQGGLFAGSVEVDETYVGGRERNRHESGKRRLGRGTAGKSPVVGARQRADGRVRAKVVSAADGQTLQGFIAGAAEQGSDVYTDDYSAYRSLQGYSREKVAHNVGEYVRGMAHTNGIESFWALLKRGYYGIYHSMSEAHLQRYVNEFAGRHNMAGQTTMNKIDQVVAGMIGRRLTYRQLIC